MFIFGGIERIILFILVFLCLLNTLFPVWGHLFGVRLQRHHCEFQVPGDATRSLDLFRSGLKNAKKMTFKLAEFASIGSIILIRYV